MQVFATFDHSPSLELVIKKLEQHGFNEIFALPLDTRSKEPRLFDTLHQADGYSLFNKGMFLAVFFSVVGASRGFVMDWGPIYWGVIGAVFGFILGFIIDVILVKRKQKKQKLLKGKKPDVILIVDCHEDEGEKVEGILWEHLAFGVAKVK